MSDRTEWPTPARMEELREHGIVPFSLLASRCFAALGTLGALLAMSDEIALLASSYGDAILRMHESNLSTLSETGLRAAGIVAIAVGSGASLSALSGLFQTRFSIRLPSRLPKRRFGALAYAIAAALSIATTAIVACSVGAIAVPSLLSLLNSRGGELHALGGQRFAWILLSALALTGAGAVLAGRLVFMWEHRTTKREAQQESDGAA